MIILYEILSFIIYSCSFFPLMIYLFFTGKISKIKDYLLLQKKSVRKNQFYFIVFQLENAQQYWIL